jgi:hypothetical protein
MIVRALSVVALLALAGTALAAHRPAPAAPTHTGRLVMLASTSGFRLQVVPASHLYPGATKTMRVTIRNPYRFAIRVAPVHATVAATTNRANCRGSRANLRVSMPKRTLKIRGHRAGLLSLVVLMPKTVANACQAATFKITLKAHAAKA